LPELGEAFQKLLFSVKSLDRPASEVDDVFAFPKTVDLIGIRLYPQRFTGSGVCVICGVIS